MQWLWNSKFKILRGGITTFRKAVSGHSRDLLGRIILETVLGRREVKGTWAFSWLTSSKLKNSPSQYTSQAKAAGDLHGQRSCSWLKRKCSNGRRERWPRRNLEMLPDHAGIGLGKLRPTWRWIWQAMWKATRWTATTILATKGRLEKMWPGCWVGHGNWWKRTWKSLRFSMFP